MTEYNKRRIDYPDLFQAYAAVSLTVSGGAVDYSVSNNTNLFSSLHYPTQILINNGSEDISVKFNQTQNDSIFIESEASFGFDNFKITDVYVTVSGFSDANLSIFTLGWQ